MKRGLRAERLTFSMVMKRKELARSCSFGVSICDMNCSD